MKVTIAQFRTVFGRIDQARAYVARLRHRIGDGSGRRAMALGKIALALDDAYREALALMAEEEGESAEHAEAIRKGGKA